MTGFEKLICKYDMARFFLVSCSDDSGWLPDYQTLIVGILPLVVGFMGLLVAWMTLRQLSKQVNAQNQQLELQKQERDETKDQQRKAALICVPHALEEIHRYNLGCFRAWMAEDRKARPEPPHSALRVIMDAVPYVDDESFESFRELVVLSQVIEARIGSHRKIREHQRLQTMLADVAAMAYLTERLFEFSRMEVKTIPYVKPTRDNLEGALYHLGGPENVASPQISQRIGDALDKRFPPPRTDDQSSNASSDED